MMRQANMLDAVKELAFDSINRGYNTVFKPSRLSLGLVSPLEHYPGSPVPEMTRHLERIQLAEQLGFSAIWLCDVPFNVPTFGDAGQTFDPFVYLGFLAGHTSKIALGVASIILPLRHPAHVARAAASADVLSGGRVILGIASGDRPEEFPAINSPYPDRGLRFRESYDYIRRMQEYAPSFENSFGSPQGGMDMLPKPTSGKLPLLITGGSQQDPEWIARHGDGWMIYPRDPMVQAGIIDGWRRRVSEAGRNIQPVLQPLYIDLAENPDARPRPIHLGFHLGIHYLKEYLLAARETGVNHIALNLRFNQAPTERTMQLLSDELLPEFHD